MSWKEYEIYITRHFKKLFPNASITHNVKRPGIISKTQRQIDILIEETVARFKLSIIVDCKYFNKKVDVKDVESFLSFLLDLKASKGVMITNKGYTQAAQNRATNDTQDVELRIIDFKDLDKFQSFAAIPISGSHCAIVSAPDGWVIDANPQGPYLASIYPAGMSQEEAFHNDGFIYLIFSHKDTKMPDLNSLIAYQDREARQRYRAPKFEFMQGIERKDCSTRMRILTSDSFPNTVDCTMFMDFPETVLFATLLSPKIKLDAYQRKLEWVCRKLLKGKVIHDATGKPASIISDEGKGKK